MSVRFKMYTDAAEAQFCRTYPGLNRLIASETPEFVLYGRVCSVDAGKVDFEIVGVRIVRQYVTEDTHIPDWPVFGEDPSK